MSSSNQKLPWLTTMLVHSILKEYRSSFQRYHDTSSGMQLIDMLTAPSEENVGTGAAELLSLADFIAAGIAEQSPDETSSPPHQVQCIGCDMGLPLSGAEHLGPNTGEPVGICERVRAAQKTKGDGK